jgi:hypothetical protein
MDVAVSKALRATALIGVITVITISGGTSVFAADETFYSGNDIIYYNPDQACPTTDTTGTNVIDVSSDNIQSALTFFTQTAGYSLAAASGITGNLMMESGLNPAIMEGGRIANDSVNILSFSGGFGIAQWTDTGRKQGLINFAKSQNTKITDLGMQLAYVQKEMAASTYSYMRSKLASNTSDPVAAAVVFHGLTPNIEQEGASIDPRFAAADAKYGFERSGDSSKEVVDNRGGAAKTMYGKYKGSISDGTGVTNVDPTVDTSSSTGSTCQSPPSDLTTSLGAGKGNFKDSGEVANYNTVLHNAQLSEQVFGDKLVSDGWCATIVARVWSNGKNSYGYSYAIDAWNATKRAIGHPDRNVKKGAILIYHSNNQVAGHVVIYLGNNKVLNDGHIVDANFPETGWGLEYLGWIDPNQLGWHTSMGTADSIKQAVVNGILGNGGSVPGQFL